MASKEDHHESANDDESTDNRWPQVSFYGAGFALSVAFWLAVVCREVPKVYLDEEFHIRQSLVYGAGEFSIWDQKITTPPGLYLASYPWLHLFRMLGVQISLQTQLRALNAVGILAVFWTAWGVADAIQDERFKLQKAAEVNASSKNKRSHDARKPTTVLTALNIALFPPLFFFSALFYTDVLSALVVLRAHLAFQRKRPVETLVWSLASLWFRQTNVFWTALYLGGLEAVRTLRGISEKRRIGLRARAKDTKTKSNGETNKTSDWTAVIQSSWTDAVLYDVDAPMAGVEDYIKTTLSLALTATTNLPSLILPLLPHLLTIAAFAGFVYWNGGVVLGDKSNHVATLHFPQMLYIWPSFVFFSFPALSTTFLNLFLSSLSFILPSSAPEPLCVRSVLPRPIVFFGATLAALAAVHFNTIVHPFLLADNRHFTFYVFRLLTRHWAIKYAAVPVYVLCGWACLTAGAAEREAGRVAGEERAGEERAAADSNKDKKPTAPVHNRKGDTPSIKTSQPSIGTCARTTTVLLWLLVSSASLVTAPLVEPRYFILPWIFWMLNLPTAPVRSLYGEELHGREQFEKERREPSQDDTQILHSDGATPPPPVAVQTRQLFARVARAAPDLQANWAAIVNLVVGYVFLFWRFEWPQNPGETMRFMW